MKAIVSVLCFYVLHTSSANRIVCPSNEVFDPCKNPCEPTCQKPSLTCKRLRCRPGCSCKPGCVRDDTTGRCIPKSYCSKFCPEGEIPTDGNPQCEPTCQNDGSYPGYQCIPNTKRCICRPGLVRDPNTGKCVTLNCCQKECGKNEIWSDCTDPNHRPSCQNNFRNYQSKVCIPGCVCKNGYLWDEESKQCIPADECLHECGENEEWEKCSDIDCRRTCSNINHTLPCPKSCKPGCSCKQGYVWDEENKKCISPNDCPEECGVNEEWEKCSNIKCRETCQHPKPKECSLACIPGCTCKDGYLWDEACKMCVTKDQCSKSCGKNEEWCEYIPDDLPSCQSLSRPHCARCRPKRGREDEPDIVALRAGCVCIEGFIWDEDATKCIPIEECLNAAISTSSVSSTSAESTSDGTTPSGGSTTESSESGASSESAATSPSGGSEETSASEASSGASVSPTEPGGSTNPASPASEATSVPESSPASEATPASDASPAPEASSASEASPTPEVTPASEATPATEVTPATVATPAP